MVRHTTAIGSQEILSHTPEGQVEKKIGSSFFRGETTNFNPYLKDYGAADFIERFVLDGLTPNEKPLNSETRITAFGSCFAANIAKHLASIGFSTSKTRNPDIYISSMGEGLVNVHALAQQFEWALEGAQPAENLWHGYTAQEFGYDEEVRKRTAEAFLQTDFFIITLGLSEVWYDEVSGGVFWRAVPTDKYDPSRHKFRVCTMAETKALIERIDELIRKHVPNAKLLFTLSPIPLAATFRPIGCLVANSVSKSILRASLDEFYRDHASRLTKDLFYFPSYEIVSSLFPMPFGKDGRHVHGYIIDFIMRLFQASFCDTDLTVAELNKEYQQARAENARTAAKVIMRLVEPTDEQTPSAVVS